MRTLALLLVLLPAFVLAQEETQPPAPPKAPTKDQVYKWVDKDGVIHYGSQPPTQGATPAKLPPLQTFKGGTVPNLNKFAKPGAAGAAGAAAPGGPINVDVVTPAKEETFRSGERVVPVAVLVTPPMGEGHKLIYVLDGTPASPPTSDTSFALTNVERGTHTVTVTLVGAAGEELATSNPVTFYMKPPTADMGAKTPPPPKPGTTPPPPKPKPKP